MQTSILELELELTQTHMTQTHMTKTRKSQSETAEVEEEGEIEGRQVQSECKTGASSLSVVSKRVSGLKIATLTA